MIHARATPLPSVVHVLDRLTQRGPTGVQETSLRTPGRSHVFVLRNHSESPNSGSSIGDSGGRLCLEPAPNAGHPRRVNFVLSNPELPGLIPLWIKNDKQSSKRLSFTFCVQSAYARADVHVRACWHKPPFHLGCSSTDPAVNCK